jgi:poly-beta-1,6 N-acetyl-D-glucosamine export porin PgaA
MQMSYSTIVAALAIGFCSSFSTAHARSLQDQAVDSARAGRFDSAIVVLQRLTREQPQHAAFRYDLIAVLSWAERHAEALDASRALSLGSQVPDYVLAAIGKSALGANQPQRAEQAYRALSQRRPEDSDAARGLASALSAGERAPAMSAERLLAAPLAQPAAAKNEIALMTTAQVRNAERIREAQAFLNMNFTVERYRLVDAALAENAALIAQAKAANETSVLLRLRRDRIVALRDRGLNQQAIEEFQVLDGEESATPSYVLAAAAEASLNQRLPEKAIRLYKRALQTDPKNAVWLSGLMYAELEAENFPAAERLVERQLSETGGAPGARRIEALILRFADRLNDAQAVTQVLADERPNDAGIWLELADLFMRRGLPRAADERYRAVLSNEPKNIKARVGLAEALWAQGALTEAGVLIEQLATDASEHPGVQRLQRAWQRKARPQVISAVTQGFGQAQVSGNDDMIWDSTFFTGQSEAGLRGFMNHHLAHASFNGQSASHERVGLGVEWTARDIQGSVEVARDLRNRQDASWAAGLSWQLNDHFSLRARHESQTNDFPLKARLPDAQSYLGAPTYLHADKNLLGAAYRWNEGRRVAADFASQDFNDSNHRESLSVSWFERLYSGYGRTLDLQTAGYTSTNTLRNAFYFNPSRDIAVSATLTGDWLTWRRYERSFNQRLALTLGSYKQISETEQGQIVSRVRYGWNDFQEIRYEHEWQLGPDFSSRYGIGARRFPYDGVNETKGFLYLFLNWRL